MKTLILATIFVLFTSNAHAKPFNMDGTDYLRICNVAKKEMFCYGYINGFLHFDTVSINKHTCPHSKVTVSQTHAVIYKYLKEHPERLHESMRELLPMALMEAWPCKKEIK